MKKERVKKGQGMSRELFRELSFKQKVQWLIQYYGIAAVVAVVAVAVLINFVVTILFPAPGPDGHVVILADEFATSEIQMYEEELEEKTGKEISVEWFTVSNVYGQASFAAKMGVDQVELVVAPREEMDQLEEAGVITDRRRIDRGDLYFAVMTNARQGEVLDTMIAYFEEQF